MINRSIAATGDLQAKLIKGTQPAPLSWRIRNTFRPAFLWGWFCFYLAKAFSALTGIVTITPELRAVLIKGDTGLRIDYGVLSYRVVTDTGVAFLVDDWDNSAQDISTMNYHGCGTGTVAEAVGDTALGTECTTALNPDSTRATGVRSQPAANQYRSVGTLTFDADTAVTEHGILSQAATGGGVLWDRSKFTAINVVGASADSIQFTYTVTINSGG